MPKTSNKKSTTKLFRIGKVAKMAGIQPFVLRFWEKEFKFKLPKAKSGHRFYTHEDVQKILTIKRLLYTEGFTIKGAMQKLAWNEDDLTGAPINSQQLTPRESSYRKTLQHVRTDLQQLLKDLS
jgi:DNA-binding transcriptional MerR regulator